MRTIKYLKLWNYIAWWGITFDFIPLAFKYFMLWCWVISWLKDFLLKEPFVIYCSLLKFISRANIKIGIWNFKCRISILTLLDWLIAMLLRNQHSSLSILSLSVRVRTACIQYSRFKWKDAFRIMLSRMHQFLKINFALSERQVLFWISRPFLWKCLSVWATQ